MADQLKFANARFATFGMLPESDGEVNAIWWRKAANSAARVYGEWSTIVLGTSPNPVSGPGGAATIFFDSLGFNQIPTIDVYHVRGGTEVWKVPITTGESYGDLVADGFWINHAPRDATRTGRTFFFLYFNPDYHRDGPLATTFTVGNQPYYGTFLIRLRGN